MSAMNEFLCIGELFQISHNLVFYEDKQQFEMLIVTSVIIIFNIVFYFFNYAYH